MHAGGDGDFVTGCCVEVPCPCLIGWSILIQVEKTVSTDADVVLSVWVRHLAHCFIGETLRHIAAPTMKTEGPMWQVGLVPTDAW